MKIKRRRPTLNSGSLNSEDEDAEIEDLRQRVLNEAPNHAEHIDKYENCVFTDSLEILQYQGLK